MLQALWEIMVAYWMFSIIAVTAVVLIGLYAVHWVLTKFQELEDYKKGYALLDDKHRELTKETQRLRGEKTSAATELARIRDAREELEGNTVERQRDFTELRERFKELEQHYEQQKREKYELFEEKEETDKKFKELEDERKSRIDELNGRLKDEARKADEYHKKAVRLEWHVRQVTQCGGRIWETPVSVKSVPEFRKRWGKHPRHARIIAMMNYKGGVGKSTIAANLGSTLWKHFGQRVLLVDLDFQASLSSLCLSRGTLDGLARDDAFSYRLFQQKPAQYEDVLFSARKIRDEESCKAHLLATDEDMSNIEERLMMQWIVGETPDDIRFRLRELLHDDMISSEYDYIILDCPPRNTTASINALACCDYVMVPVLLDQTSAQAVPRLLSLLQRLKKDDDVPPICRNLNILGIVANRALQDGRLTPEEHHVWTELDRFSKKAWGVAEKWWDTDEDEPEESEDPQETERRRAPGFGRSIPDRVDFGRAAGKNELCVFQSSEIQRVFVELAEQVMARVQLHEEVATAHNSVDEPEDEPFVRGAAAKPGVFARPKRSVAAAGGNKSEDKFSLKGDVGDNFNAPQGSSTPVPPSHLVGPPQGGPPQGGAPRSPGTAANAPNRPAMQGGRPSGPQINYNRKDRPSGGPRKPRPQ